MPVLGATSSNTGGPTSLRYFCASGRDRSFRDSQGRPRRVSRPEGRRGLGDRDPRRDACDHLPSTERPQALHERPRPGTVRGSGRRRRNRNDASRGAATHLRHAAPPPWVGHPAPLVTVSNASRERSGHGDQGQEREEEHGEEARAEDAEGEAAGKEGQAVAESGAAPRRRRIPACSHRVRRGSRADPAHRGRASGGD